MITTEPLTGTFALISCFNHISDALSMSLNSGFRISFFSIRPVQEHSNRGFVFSNHFDSRIYETKFPIHVSFRFTYSIC